MNNQMIPVSFHGDELALIDHDGEPFVAMRPVVEGMGLDWKSQWRRLSGERFSSSVVEMTTVAQDGKPREMTCLPLRKLTGWLLTVNANKVNPVIKDKIIAYQNECDDALWDYWTEGFAVNQRAAGQDFAQGAFREFQTTKAEVLEGVVKVNASMMELGSIYGLEGNQLRLYVNRAVEKQTGIAPMALLGITNLINDDQEMHYTATEIGKKYRMSANSMNKLLATVGLQRRFEYRQGKYRWELLPDGRKHAVILDTTKRHGDGTPVQQIRWKESVMQVLKHHANKLKGTAGLHVVRG